MAEHVIPTPPVGVYHWILRREFDAGFHRMRFRWNERVQSWYLEIANDEGERQVSGIRLGTGDDKLRAFKARDVPQGSLNVVDSTGQGLQPTLENFGKTVQLKYVDAEVVEPVSLSLAQPDNLPAPPFPPGPDPALHGPTHENEGIDEVRLLSLNAGESIAGRVLTYVGDNTAAWLPPALIEDLPTNEVGTTKVLQPDASGGVQWNEPISSEPAGPFVSFFHSTNSPPVGSTTPVAITWDSDGHGGTPDATYFTYPVSVNRLQINKAGRYMITAGASLEHVNTSNDSLTFFMALYLNESDTGQPFSRGFMPQNLASSSWQQPSFSVPMTLAVDDTLHIGFRCFANPVSFFQAIAGTAKFSVTYLGPVP